MIVKMKFLSISGPKNDIDRVCEVYLSKYEMQLENAAAELKTTDNLQPFVEVNPYKEPLAKAEQFSALLADEDRRIDVSMNQEDMLNLIRDVNHDYLDLLEKKELTKKQVDEYKEKLLIMEPFRTLELDMQKSLKYKYMKVRFGRVDVNYYKRLEKYLFDDLNAVFIEGTRNENYVYGCYFVSNADSSKVDSVFNSLHFERIAIPSEYIGTPAQACEELEKEIEEKQKEIAGIKKQISELMAKNAAKLRGAKKRLEELSPGNIVICRGDHFFNLHNQANYLPFNLTLLPKMKITSSPTSTETKFAADGTPCEGHLWISKKEGNRAWIQFDFKNEYLISRYVVRHSGNAGLPERLNTRSFSIEVSQDGKKWTRVDIQKENTVSVTDVDITPTSGRYVRLLIQDAGEDGIARIGDVEIYGCRK